MNRKEYTAQWRYRSSLGTLDAGQIVKLTEAEAQAYNQDSPGVLVPSHDESVADSPELSVEGRAMEGPPQDRMFREEDVESRDMAEIDATEAAIKFAEEHGIDLSQVEGTGSGGRVILADVQVLIE